MMHWNQSVTDTLNKIRAVAQNRGDAEILKLLEPTSKAVQRSPKQEQADARIEGVLEELREAHEELAALGITVRDSRMGRHTIHVRFYRPQDTIFAHWYPTKGTLYLGKFPDQQVPGEFTNLHHVLENIQ